jgi:hypothetical protein
LLYCLRFDLCQPRNVFLAGTLSVVAWGLALGLAAASGPSTEAKPVQVEIEAPSGCANANDFLKSLQARSHLVRQATGDEPRTTLQVRLIEMRRYVLGELRMLDDSGAIHTRKMQGANCDDVVEALSLAAAVALDPSVLLAEPAPVATSAAAPAAPANVPPTTVPAVRSPVDVQRTTDAVASPASHEGHRFELGAAAVGSMVLSSGMSPGLSVFGRWTPAGSDRFRPTMGMAVTYLRNDVLGSPAAAQASLTGLVLTLCGEGWGARALSVKPCGLVMAGLLSVSGRQVVHSSSVDVFWLGAGADVRTAVRLGLGFSLELEAGASAAFIRREFYTTLPSHVVEKTATISPLASLGLAYGF